MDQNNRVVTVDTTHFTLFALFPVNPALDLLADQNLLAKEHFLTPVPQDGINDVATFGAGARELHITDLQGRQVFEASMASGSALAWNGRDASGALVQPGPYIAIMDDMNRKRHYQIIVIAK